MKTLSGNGKVSGLTLIKIIIFLFLLAGLGFPSNTKGQGFVNLGFENAKLVLDSNAAGSLWPYYSTNAFPNWICYVDGVPQTHITYNDFPLESASVTLQDTNSALGIYPVQGKYALFLKGGTQWSSNGRLPAIGQTGTIPATALSMSYWGQIWNGLQVTFNGQAISFNSVSNVDSYSFMVADISPYAGQTGELLFSGQGFVDTIRFSNIAVPEPNSIVLFSASLIAIFVRCFRK